MKNKHILTLSQFKSTAKWTSVAEYKERTGVEILLPNDESKEIEGYGQNTLYAVTDDSGQCGGYVIIFMRDNNTPYIDVDISMTQYETFAVEQMDDAMSYLYKEFYISYEKDSTLDLDFSSILKDNPFYNWIDSHDFKISHVFGDNWNDPLFYLEPLNNPKECRLTPTFEDFEQLVDFTMSHQDNILKLAL